MTTPTAGTVRFNHPREVEQAYTQGDCWYLAETIHDLAGYPLVTAQWDEEPMAVYYAATGKWWRSPGGSYWAHAANRLPDGRILDIQGIWKEEDWLSHWHNLHHQRRTLFVKEWSGEEWLAEAHDNQLEIRYWAIAPHTETHAKEILTHV